MIMALYARPEFYVEQHGVSSEWKRQTTGIRQGCPLSPYLLVVLMTVLLEDVKRRYELNLEDGRVLGTDFDEVLYAGDTICIAQDEETMNGLLAAIVEEGGKMGMKLNLGKCEALVFGTVGEVLLGEQLEVAKVQLAKYLGCKLNNKGDGTRELSSRISECMATLKRLDLFWLHGDCGARVKLHVYDAVIRSKLVYGLESLQLNATTLKQLDVFQLKGLRTILGMTTTYVDRTNTNREVYARAEERMNQGREPARWKCHQAERLLHVP